MLPLCQGEGQEKKEKCEENAVTGSEEKFGK
jgi:hypothetical protein